MIARPREVSSFIATLDSSEPTALTACPGRTVHLIGSHMAGSYKEMTRHVDAYLAGKPLTRSRMFEEREPEFRNLSSPDLIAAVDRNESQLRSSMSELIEREPDATLMWTSRMVRADGFLKHSRNECAVHRWDVTGDDDESRTLLSQQELFEHVLSFIGAAPMTARGCASGAGRGRSLTARVRATGQPDLEIRVIGGVPAFQAVPPMGEALLECDPAARVLLLWGRRAVPFHRVVCNGSGEDLLRLQWLLAGY